jgi:hypothetical protein
LLWTRRKIRISPELQFLSQDFLSMALIGRKEVQVFLLICDNWKMVAKCPLINTLFQLSINNQERIFAHLPLHNIHLVYFFFAHHLILVEETT